MRRLLTLVAVLALSLLALPSPASAADWTSCGSASTKIGSKTYVIAIKIKAKGLDCSAAKTFWVNYGTGTQGSPTDEQLRPTCTEGPKKQKKLAAKKNRFAYQCASGGLATRAWVLGG